MDFLSEHGYTDNKHKTFARGVIKIWVVDEPFKWQAFKWSKAYSTWNYNKYKYVFAQSYELSKVCLTECVENRKNPINVTRQQCELLAHL